MKAAELLTAGPGRHLHLHRRLLLLGSLAAALPAWGGEALSPPAGPRLEPATLDHAHTLVLDSRHTGQRYRIWLGLPDGPPGPGGYPALFALDGQAAFALMDPGRARPQGAAVAVVAAAASQSRSARQHEDFRRGKQQGRRSPGLLLGIGYASGQPLDLDARALDYTPTDACAPCDRLSPRHGGAGRFLDFIELELLPTLAALLPDLPLDRERLSLFGHSYGGLFTLYTLLHRPALFARYWASSPSLWFGDRHLLRGLDERLVQLKKPAGERRLHLSVGLLERSDLAQSAERNARLRANRMVDNAQDFLAALRASAWPGLRISHAELADHDHGAMFLHGASAAPGFAFSDWN